MRHQKRSAAVRRVFGARILTNLAPTFETDRVASPETNIVTDRPRERVWLDACVRPNVSMSDRGLVVLTASISVSVTISATVLALGGAWPASLFAGGEGLAVLAFVIWHAQRLRQQEQRVVLTDTVLIVAYRARVGAPPRINELDPAWVRVERRREKVGECTAAFVCLRDRRVPFGEALTPGERESLANALEAALNERRRFGIAGESGAGLRISS